MLRNPRILNLRISLDMTHILHFWSSLEFLQTEWTFSLQNLETKATLAEKVPLSEFDWLKFCDKYSHLFPFNVIWK